ncbi:MAG: glycosyltransferase [Endomicrobia bacterium]|nr:glycosyltransferase [Endomicrobiia bacterium]MCL2506254.1 glycosyltransferase [Endomicrobiia bacterium]
MNVFSKSDNGAGKVVYKLLGIEFFKKKKNIYEKSYYIFGIKYWKKNISKRNTAYSPLVSVIIPCYNHEKYLKTRLESVYNQTYKNIEVILLDDASSDNSREILQKYALKHSNTKVFFNDTNSGGVFIQWGRGLSLAKGELVWIAESDDYCSNNFLEETVGFFVDESVSLSFARTVFVNEKGNKIWDIESYLSDITSKQWINSRFVETAHKIVNEGFGFKNLVPNVSSAIFRNTGFKNILNDKNWFAFKLCGDWLFYLFIIRGGRIAYSSFATNYYRYHESNLSIAIRATPSYYTEHEKIAEYVAENYKVDKEIFIKQAEMLKKHALEHNNKFAIDAFEKLYNLHHIYSRMSLRKPNLLMASYGFASGGGEVLPIFIANRLKDTGVAVTFFDHQGLPENTEIKAMLDKSIPILKKMFLNGNDELNDFAFDIIQTQYAHVETFFSTRKGSAKHIAVLHGMYEAMENEVFETKWVDLPMLTKNIDRWLYTTGKNLDAFKKYNCYDESRFFKINNGLPESVESKNVVRQDLSIPEDAFVLCLVSRAIEDKGWNEAIEAVNLANKSMENKVHLILIGDGPVYETLKKETLIPKYIHILGFKKNIRDYFKLSDMSILPSRFKGESFPLVIIDSLLTDKPVIASDIGEIRNMLSSENEELAGQVFKLNDWKIPVEELSSIIKDFANNKYKYNAAISVVTKIKDRFSIANVAAEYLKHYNDLT